MLSVSSRMWFPIIAILCICVGMVAGQRADCSVTMAGGPQVGVACAFPFVFNGFIYREEGGRGNFWKKQLEFKFDQEFN